MIEVADWEHLLLAYLINPIDKSIEVQGHEARAARYASRALGRGVVCSELEAIAQQINAASAFEQIPMPLAGVDRICRSAGLEIRHPICGDRAELTGLLLKQEIVENVIGVIVSGLSDPRMRFLSIWRLLPNKLADCLGPYYPLLPADARIPDHSLIHQADVRSGYGGEPPGRTWRCVPLPVLGTRAGVHCCRPHGARPLVGERHSFLADVSGASPDP